MSTENILVIKLGALGDFIQALGPMAAIRKHHPDAKITLLTTKPYYDFGKSCGYYDDVLIDKKPKFLDIKGWLNLRTTLRKAHFSRVYDLQNNDRTALYLRLFPKTERPEWVGSAHGASHRNSSPLRTAGHAFDGHIQTLRLAGIHNVSIDNLAWMDADISDFGLCLPYALIVPGSAPKHPYKRWPAENYALLCKELARRGIQPVILGTNTESHIAALIKKLCPEAVDLTAKTNLFQIAVLARNASFAIGNDTGPMHMIAPTGCRCLVLFSGHSNPKRHTPLGTNILTLQEKDLKNLNLETVMGTFGF